MRVVLLVCLMVSVAGAVAPRWPDKRSTDVFLDTSRWPIVEAEVVGATVVPDAQDMRLVLPDDPSRVVTATSIRKDEAAPYAVAFLVLGSAEFLHDESLGPNFGMLIGLASAIDKADLSHALPEGSEFSIVTYATGAALRVPWSPMHSLRGSLFGEEAEYAGQTGRDLTAGIDAALGQLETSQAPTKVLIVLSDGHDPNATKAQWEALKVRMTKDRVRAYALVFKASAKESNIAMMTKNVINASDLPNYLGGDLGQIVFEIKTRFWATFDVNSMALDTTKPIELAAEVPGARTEPLVIDLSTPAADPRNPVPRPGEQEDHDDTPLWPLLVAGVVLLALPALFMVRRP